jgi:hypothetical protein
VSIKIIDYHPLLKQLCISFSAESSVVAGSDRSSSGGTSVLLVDGVGLAIADSQSDHNEGDREQDPIDDGESDGGVRGIARA